MRFVYTHQMNNPKKGMDPKKSGKQQLNAKDPDSIIKAFHEAFAPFTSCNCCNSTPKLIDLRRAEIHLMLQHY